MKADQKERPSGCAQPEALAPDPRGGEEEVGLDLGTGHPPKGKDGSFAMRCCDREDGCDPDDLDHPGDRNITG